VVLDRLDFGFGQAERHGLACCICECPWARRYGGAARRHGGVQYRRDLLHPGARPVFDLWKRYGAEVDSSIRFYRGQNVVVMPHNDQAGFAKAVAESGFNPFGAADELEPATRLATHLLRPRQDLARPQRGALKLRFWNEEQVLEQAIIRYSGGE
jgi:hypothetical protein